MYITNRYGSIPIRNVWIIILRLWLGVSLQPPTMNYYKEYILENYSGYHGECYQLRRIKNIGLGKQTLLQDIIHKRGEILVLRHVH